MISLLNVKIQRLVDDLKASADMANSLAAKARVERHYENAEELDRRAEALRCAAHLVETRGMS